MPALEQKYPQYRGYIEQTRSLGYDDVAIENAILRKGVEPVTGAKYDNVKDASFFDVMSEKFTIEEDESFLDFIGGCINRDYFILVHHI